MTARLRESRYQVLRGLRSVDAAGTVRLIGRLPTHHLKQIALALAIEAAGAAPIVLDVTVEGAPPENLMYRGVGRQQLA